MVIKREEVRNTDFAGGVTGRRLATVHPGEVLLKEFVAPPGITHYNLAKANRT